MSDTQEHTVETAYGQATIETYECDSCGNRVAHENTVPFTLGNTDGRACEHCQESGPVSFPKRVVEWQLPYDTLSDGERFPFWESVLCAPLVLPFDVLFGFMSEADSYARGAATAVSSLVVWIGAAFLLWVIFA